MPRLKQFDSGFNASQIRAIRLLVRPLAQSLGQPSCRIIIPNLAEPFDVVQLALGPVCPTA
jgi:hypothetical protein